MQTQNAKQKYGAYIRYFIKIDVSISFGRIP